MQGSVLVSDVIERQWKDRLDSAAPGAKRVVLTPEGPSAALDDVEVFFFSADLYPERAPQSMAAAAQAQQLRWLHSFSAGVDHPVFLALLERGVRVSHSSGASARTIAQTVVMLMLALARDLPAWQRDQQQRLWRPRRIEDLVGKTLGIVGMGHIGGEVARIASVLGMEVIGIRREVTGSEPAETWPVERLDELCRRADYLVLTLSLNDRTRGIFGAERIARCKPGCYLINVGRGELVDEAALAAALASGHLAGAGLDVFQAEPLPADSPLWSMENVIVTPHSAGDSKASADNATGIFLDNLSRYRRGDTLRNEVLAQPRGPLAT